VKINFRASPRKSRRPYALRLPPSARLRDDGTRCRLARRSRGALVDETHVHVRF
jgi:hypothetical protein